VLEEYEKLSRLSDEIVELIERRIGRLSGSAERCEAAFGAIGGALGIVMREYAEATGQDPPSADDVAQVVRGTVEDVFRLARLPSGEVH